MRPKQEWIRSARAAAAAERASAICSVLGHPLTRAAVEDTIMRLWRVAEGSEEVRALDGADAMLASLPDANADDSHLPSYDTMRAIAITAYAVESAHSALGSRDDVLDAAADLWSGIDFVLEPTAEPANPEPGKLEARERALQAGDLRLLIGQAREKAVRKVRDRAVAARRDLDQHVRSYARIRGWGEPSLAHR